MGDSGPLASEHGGSELRDNPRTHSAVHVLFAAGVLAYARYDPSQEVFARLANVSVGFVGCLSPALAFHPPPRPRPRAPRSAPPVGYSCTPPAARVPSPTLPAACAYSPG